MKRTVQSGLCVVPCAVALGCAAGTGDFGGDEAGACLSAGCVPDVDATPGPLAPTSGALSEAGPPVPPSVEAGAPADGAIHPVAPPVADGGDASPPPPMTDGAADASPPPPASDGAAPPVCGDGLCEAGETCASCPVDCGPCAGPPAAVSCASLSPSGGAGAGYGTALGWSPVTGATSYEVAFACWDEAASTWFPTDVFPLVPVTTIIVDEGLPPPVACEWAVVACNGDGCGPQSCWAEFEYE